MIGLDDVKEMMEMWTITSEYDKCTKQVLLCF